MSSIAGLATVAANGAVVALVLGATILLPTGKTPVAVLGDPTVVMRAVADAGGLLLGVERSWVVIAASDSPDFVIRLYAAGAIMVIDARITGFCRTEQMEASR